MATEKQSGPNSAALEARIEVLEELFVRLAQAGATESILDHGFKQVSDRLKTVSRRLEDISYQVAPLRTLGPQPPEWTSQQKALIDNLESALMPPPSVVKQTPSAENVLTGVHKRSAS